jgi:molybdate transport system permease protein
MFLPNPERAAVLSVEVGLWCAVLGCPIAIALGWVLARKQFLGKSLFGTILFAPLVLPPVITGFLLLKIFSLNHVLGRWLESLGLPIPFSFPGVVLAALTVGLPLYIMAVRNAFEAVDSKFEEVSLTLGNPPFQTFLRVSLPLALPGIFAGALLAFARALGEFGATIVLAGNSEGKTRTLALAIYTLLESPGGEEATYRLLWISLGLAFSALLLFDLMTRWQRRRLEMDKGM